MKQIIIGKLVKYGSSKTSASAYAAGNNPGNLAAGAVGIYGECNDGNLRLITYTGSSTATTVLYTDFLGTTNTSNIGTYGGSRIRIAQGTATTPPGALLTPPIEYFGGTTKYSAFGTENSLAFPSIFYAGYNGGTGLLQWVTPSLNDEILIDVEYKTTQSTPNWNVSTFSATLLSTDTPISGLVKLVNTINNPNSYVNQVPIFSADIIVNATGATLSGTGSMVLTNGSNTVTVTTISGVAVGGYLLFQNNRIASPAVAADDSNSASAAVTASNNIAYQITALPSATTITLDRPYTGITQTIVVANWTTNNWVTYLAASSLPTTFSGGYGIRMVSTGNYIVNTFAIGANITGSTISYFRPMLTGSGTYAEISGIEKKYGSYGGYLNTVDGQLLAVQPQPLYTDPSVNNYDVYVLNVNNTVHNNAVVGGEFQWTDTKELMIVFPTSTTSSQDNEQEFDLLIRAFYPAIIDNVSLSS
jgi:hypothetical protein